MEIEIKAIGLEEVHKEIEEWREDIQRATLKGETVIIRITITKN